MLIEFFVDPIPKARPRFNPFSKRIYTPKNTSDFENFIRKEACRHLGLHYEYPVYEVDVPLCVHLDFIFKRPQNFKHAKYPDNLMWRPKMPDLDNLEKIIYDGLNGIVWEDDRQIVENRSKKLLAEKNNEPRICMHVFPAGNPPVVPCHFPRAEELNRIAREKQEKESSDVK